MSGRYFYVKFCSTFNRIDSSGRQCAIRVYSIPVISVALLSVTFCFLADKRTCCVEIIPVYIEYSPYSSSLFIASIIRIRLKNTSGCIVTGCRARFVVIVDHVIATSFTGIRAGAFSPVVVYIIS